jgi:hypothetical protein
LNIRKVFNPQRWNVYGYGTNNPLKICWSRFSDHNPALRRSSLKPLTKEHPMSTSAQAAANQANAQDEAAILSEPKIT